MDSKIEATYKILKEYQKPLHTKKIIEIALSKQMIETKGKRPTATLYTNIIHENRRREKSGRKPRFYRVGPSVWALSEWK